MAAAVAILVAIAAAAALRPRKVSGYWLSEKTNSMFEVRTEGAGLTVRSGGQARSGKNRGIYLRVNGERGRVSPDGRRIYWSNGDTWFRQGLTQD